MMTKFCSQCGYENDDSSLFCNQCGNKFKGEINDTNDAEPVKTLPSIVDDLKNNLFASSSKEDREIRRRERQERKKEREKQKEIRRRERQERNKEKGHVRRERRETNRERWQRKGDAKLEKKFNNMRDEVSHLLPEAAQMLNVPLDECYLTFKTSRKNLIDAGKVKFHHHDKVIILMSIFDDKLSYVVMARLHQFNNNIKEMGLEEEVYSLYFDKISGISYTKMGLDLTMIGGENITLRATDLFGNKITKELTDKYNIYNENKNNISDTSNSQPINKADTLIKYKELLDAGALTQEEFDKLKEEVINS